MQPIALATDTPLNFPCPTPCTHRPRRVCNYCRGTRAPRRRATNYRPAQFHRVIIYTERRTNGRGAARPFLQPPSVLRYSEEHYVACEHLLERRAERTKNELRLLYCIKECASIDFLPSSFYWLSSRGFGERDAYSIRGTCGAERSGRKGMIIDSDGV